MPAVEREEGVVVIGRAEIDTRPPFRSVKEAVMLFGEKVLVGEIYGNKLKQMQTKTREPVSMTKPQHQPSQLVVVSADHHELEETKQSLQKAKEESHFMAYYLQSLKQDLEETKRELKQLKRRETLEEQPVEIEELKFIENPGKVEVTTRSEDEEEEEAEENGNFAGYFEKKRSVKFASPPSLARVITTPTEDQKETTANSKKKMKRKPIFPLFGTLFSKKKEPQVGVTQSTRSLNSHK